MIELLFAIGVILTTIVALIAVFQTIPSVVTIFSVVTNNTDQIAASINDFVSIFAQYAQPWIGLLNLIIPQPVKTALVAMIIWRLFRPIGLNIIEITTGVSRKIIEKLL